MFLLSTNRLNEVVSKVDEKLLSMIKTENDARHVIMSFNVYTSKHLKKDATKLSQATKVRFLL